MPGETSLCRPRLSQFCAGYGIDVGYGGDPIIPSAITMDLPSPYTHVGATPLNLGGDAKDLYWFADNVLDFLFSSHVLEDFTIGETKNVLLEWLRVLKVGGNLVLYLPEEQRYRKHCKETGQSYNYSHKIDHFGFKYIKNILKEIENVEVIHEDPNCEIYSFEIVAKKKGLTEPPQFDFSTGKEILPAALPAESDSVAHCLDTFSQFANRLEITGWAFIKGSESDVIRTEVVLQAKKKNYLVRTKVVKRPDVAAATQAENVVNSGFATQLSYSGIQSGTYGVSLLITQGQSKYLCHTDKSVFV
jgi:predicted SAM-dependent methyltransferase